MLFDTGRIADVILSLLALEAMLAIVLLRRDRSRFARLVPMLLAGALLVVALRGALTGAGWPWIAPALAGAFLAHLADLRLRLRQDTIGPASGINGGHAMRRKEAAS